MAEYTFRRGDEWSATFTVLNGAGAPLDLTGLTLRFTAVQRPVPTVTIAKTTGSGIVHATQSGGTIGKATVTLVAADTSGLVAYPIAFEYDLQVSPASGGPYTTETGWVLVRPDMSIPVP